VTWDCQELKEQEFIFSSVVPWAWDINSVEWQAAFSILFEFILSPCVVEGEE
jgi:hypothetical protein